MFKYCEKKLQNHVQCDGMIFGQTNIKLELTKANFVFFSTGFP